MNLDNLLKLLTETLKESDFGEDTQKITFFYNELQKLKNELPTVEKLEELKNIEFDLEVKYDDFVDLSYYFDPLYVEIKHKIHREEIKKIREENKRKRSIK